jgi:hypothetical protein
MRRGLTAMVRSDSPFGDGLLTGSLWVLLARDPDQLAAVQRLSGDTGWHGLRDPAERVWTDDHASILPYVKWHNLMGTK